MAFVCLLMAPLPRPLRYRITIAWPRWQVIAARLILGIRWEIQGDRKSTRLNSSHSQQSRMPSSA